MSKHVWATAIGAVAVYFVIAIARAPLTVKVITAAVIVGGILAMSWLLGWAIINLWRSICARKTP